DGPRRPRRDRAARGPGGGARRPPHVIGARPGVCSRGRPWKGDGMREDIEFDAEGATLRGWFYLPEGAAGEVPCVVMAHGFSAIKEMRLDAYAEVFCDAGLACVVYDNRGFGASDAAPGKPRLEIDPWEQVRDYQHAITYAQSR